MTWKKSYHRVFSFLKMDAKGLSAIVMMVKLHIRVALWRRG